MDDVENLTQAQIASHTFAYFRRLEGRFDAVDQHLRLIDRHQVNTSEVLLRQDTRLGRIERDLGELKSDLVLLENQILNRMNEVFHITRQLDEHSQRLSALEATVGPQS